MLFSDTHPGVHVDLKAVHKITKHDPTPPEVRALCRIPPDRFPQAVHWGLVFELQPQVAIRKLLPMWVLTQLFPETGQGYQHVELVEFYDDYIHGSITTGTPDSTEHERNATVMHETCEEVSLLVKPEKDKGPTTRHGLNIRTPEKRVRKVEL